MTTFNVGDPVWLDSYPPEPIATFIRRECDEPDLGRWMVPVVLLGQTVDIPANDADLRVREMPESKP